MPKSQKKKIKNKWFNNKEAIDADIVEMSDQAAIIHDSVIKFLSGFQNYIKDLHRAENKHPLMKAAGTSRSYKEGMVNQSEEFEKAAVAFEKWFAIIATAGHELSSNALAKIVSFKDVECKEIDGHMKRLCKLQSDMASKKKKEEKDDKCRVLAQAAEESFKKGQEEAREMLKKFISDGCSIMNNATTEITKTFGTYCDEGTEV